MSDAAVLTSLKAQNAVLKAELANLQAMAAAKAAKAGSSSGVQFHAPAARAEPAAEAVGVMAAPAAADAGADEATTRADILKLFEIYDDDKSGFIDRQEFELLCADLGEVQAPEELTASLASIDGNADGKISVDEFTAWFLNPERVRATPKSTAQLAMMKLKLKGKLLARQALVAQQAAQDSQRAADAEDTKAKFQVDVGLGDLPAVPGIKLGVNLRNPEEDEVKDIMRTYGMVADGEDALDARVMFSVDIGLTELATDAQTDALCASLHSVLELAKGELPPFLQIKATRVSSGNRPALRVCAFMADNPDFELPPPEVVAIFKMIEWTPLTIAMPHPLSYFLTNGDAVLADALAVRVQAGLGWSREFVDTILAMAPTPEVLGLMILAGFGLTFKFGSIKDLCEKIHNIIANFFVAKAEAGEVDPSEEQNQGGFMEMFPQLFLSQPELEAMRQEFLVPQLVNQFTVVPPFLKDLIKMTIALAYQIENVRICMPGFDVHLTATGLDFGALFAGLLPRLEEAANDDPLRERRDQTIEGIRDSITAFAERTDFKLGPIVARLRVGTSAPDHVSDAMIATMLLNIPAYHPEGRYRLEEIFDALRQGVTDDGAMEDDIAKMNAAFDA